LKLDLAASPLVVGQSWITSHKHLQAVNRHLLAGPGVDQPFIRHEIRPFIADLADLGFGDQP
jgi:hypothetical protein